SPLSFCVQLLGVASLALRLSGRGNRAGDRPGFFSFRQCFLPFIECFLARVQLRFSLSKLLFGGRILFLAGTNRRNRDEHQKGKKFFHSSNKIYLVPVILTKKTDSQRL